MWGPGWWRWMGPFSTDESTQPDAPLGASVRHGRVRLPPTVGARMPAANAAKEEKVNEMFGQPKAEELKELEKGDGKFWIRMWNSNASRYVLEEALEGDGSFSTGKVYCTVRKNYYYLVDDIKTNIEELITGEELLMIEYLVDEAVKKKDGMGIQFIISIGGKENRIWAYQLERLHEKIQDLAKKVREKVAAKTAAEEVICG